MADTKKQFWPGTEIPWDFVVQQLGLPKPADKPNEGPVVEVPGVEKPREYLPQSAFQDINPVAAPVAEAPVEQTPVVEVSDAVSGADAAATPAPVQQAPVAEPSILNKPPINISDVGGAVGGLISKGLDSLPKPAAPVQNQPPETVGIPLRRVDISKTPQTYKSLAEQTGQQTEESVRGLSEVARVTGEYGNKEAETRNKDLVEQEKVQERQRQMLELSRLRREQAFQELRDLQDDLRSEVKPVSSDRSMAIALAGIAANMGQDTMLRLLDAQIKSEQTAQESRHGSAKDRVEAKRGEIETLGHMQNSDVAATTAELVVRRDILAGKIEALAASFKDPKAKADLIGLAAAARQKGIEDLSNLAAKQATYAQGQASLGIQYGHLKIARDREKREAAAQDAATKAAGIKQALGGLQTFKSPSDAPAEERANLVKIRLTKKVISPDGKPTGAETREEVWINVHDKTRATEIQKQLVGTDVGVDIIDDMKNIGAPNWKSGLKGNVTNKIVRSVLGNEQDFSSDGAKRLTQKKEILMGVLTQLEGQGVISKDDRDRYSNMIGSAANLDQGQFESMLSELRSYVVNRAATTLDQFVDNPGGTDQFGTDIYGTGGTSYQMKTSEDHKNEVVRPPIKDENGVIVAVTPADERSGEYRSWVEKKKQKTDLSPGGSGDVAIEQGTREMIVKTTENIKSSQKSMRDANEKIKKIRAKGAPSQADLAEIDKLNQEIESNRVAIHSYDLVQMDYQRELDRIKRDKEAAEKQKKGQEEDKKRIEFMTGGYTRPFPKSGN